MVTIRTLVSTLLLVITLGGCAKVDPAGLIIAPSNVEDRYKQSWYFFDQERQQLKREPYLEVDGESYRILIGADLHAQSNLTRMTEFFQEATNPEKGYLFSTILGDIAETQPEYYLPVVDSIEQIIKKDGKSTHNFYAVVGNHDVTHNGWAYFSSLFGTSTYYLIVSNKENTWGDLHVFFDSANGTVGKGQLYDFFPMISAIRPLFRNCFFYTHCPFFRPPQAQTSIASTYPREELYYLLNYFADNRVNYVFTGHIHMRGEYEFRDVQHVSVDCLSEINRPDRAEMCVVDVKGEGNSNIFYDFIYTK